MEGPADANAWRRASGRSPRGRLKAANDNRLKRRGEGCFLIEYADRDNPCFPGVTDATRSLTIMPYAKTFGAVNDGGKNGAITSAPDSRPQPPGGLAQLQPTT